VLLGVPPSDALFGELVEWADGWIPMSMPTADELAPHIERLRRRWAQATRDPLTLRVAVMQWPDADQVARDLERFIELGVGWLLLDVPTAPADAVLPILDELARIPALAR
jgi:hypothetical protein